MELMKTLFLVASFLNSFLALNIINSTSSIGSRIRSNNFNGSSDILHPFMKPFLKKFDDENSILKCPICQNENEATKCTSDDPNCDTTKEAYLGTTATATNQDKTVCCSVSDPGKQTERIDNEEPVPSQPYDEQMNHYPACSSTHGFQVIISRTETLCLLFSPYRKQMNAARDDCRKRNSSLTFIHVRSKLFSIRTAMTALKGREYPYEGKFWIGGMRKQRQIIYKGENGEAIDEDSDVWKKGKPEYMGDCLQAEPDGLSDVLCENADKHHYACEVIYFREK